MRLSRWSGSLPLGNDTRARERAAGLYNLFILRLSRWSGRRLGADTRELERAAISEVMPLVMDRRTVQEPLRTPILPVRALAAAKNVEEEHHTNTSSLTQNCAKVTAVRVARIRWLLFPFIPLPSTP